MRLAIAAICVGAILGLESQAQGDECEEVKQLSDYLAPDFKCTIRNREFSGFTAFNTNVDYAKIKVKKLDKDEYAGFDFSGFTAPNDGFISLQMVFKVKALNNTPDKNTLITGFLLRVKGIKPVVDKGTWTNTGPFVTGDVTAYLSYREASSGDTEVLNVRATSPLSKEKSSDADLAKPLESVRVGAGVAINNTGKDKGGKFESVQHRFYPNPK
jgi:hypothetical protein